MTAGTPGAMTDHPLVLVISGLLAIGIAGCLIRLLLIQTDNQDKASGMRAARIAALAMLVIFFLLLAVFVLVYLAVQLH